MTKHDESILTKEIRGLNLKTIFTALGVLGAAMGMGYRHYSGIMHKLEGMDRRLEIMIVNDAFQDKTLERHELLLTSKQ